MFKVHRSYIKICSSPDCGEYTENAMVDYCASHNRQLRKSETDAHKQVEKRSQAIEKARIKSQVPRKAISKNPKDWSNTFLCSDGTRIKQSTIDFHYNRSKVAKYGGKEIRKCEGCGTLCNANAHIISKARCKLICKTELIWHFDNYFPACNKCNSAIENPKGKAWKSLNNIEKCLAFIKQHDPELFAKFEQSAINQEKETI